ncbi:chemotaxis protein CheA [Brevundimonas poindexterae]|uniref:chemotaxis protein CheA n=1 Tax=Brevundimonas poindexterae TaxID=74325 RepID=UPI001CFC77E4|nr:chemotaxis protein CheA [Brevundimonas poindexterae]
MDPMEEIKATFFQECDELLADLESGLLEMEAGATDPETVNAVFRAVHSVKGGAGAFGLDTLVRFAHVFETTLDAVRNQTLEADAAVVRVMLRSADRLSDHITAAKAGEDLGEEGDQALIQELQAFLGDVEDDTAGDDMPDFGFKPMLISLGDDPAPLELAPVANGPWEIILRPQAALYRNGNDPAVLLRELAMLGQTTVTLDDSGVPDLNDLDAQGAYLCWTVSMPGTVEEDRIREVFEFADFDCDLTIRRSAGEGANEIVEAPLPVLAVEEAPAVPEPLADAPVEGEAFSLDAILAMARDAAAATELTGDVPAPQADVSDVSQAPAPQGSAVEASPPASAPPRAASEASTGSSATPTQQTIRVDLDRVDRLIDLVGELVINQAMLAQKVLEEGAAPSGSVALGLDDLEQLTREIQDSVMAIRAQPVKSVFQRMPRLVREVAGMTGKSVRLVTEGENTEVDKTVIERLSDPLTHMIRNAIDHGLETPEQRREAGKPEEGTIRLAALHRSGRIVIEISDDGKGIDRTRVKAIAVERGLIDADATLTDEEIDNLIFAPGFSTASTISDISGRGVGMDVVKRSIQALGGRITITSTPGKGSLFTLSLPLTLAVLDGMVVTVGDQTLVVPITVIVETLQPKASDIRGLGPEGTVLAVRGSHVPMVDVGQALKFPSQGNARAGVTLLVESELGGLIALRVDAIQGQRQVVIKSLEQNYRQVSGIAAATILGDGRVALILDVDGLVATRRPAVAPQQPLAQAS